MQRVRMSLPYFTQYNWEAEVVTVDPIFTDLGKDELLLHDLPNATKIHKIRALSKKWTSKLGLGSLALRSLWFYKTYVNRLLKNEHFDLIYFSTTQFPVMILGNYWKKKFNIPYVIDMQDPWHSNYYQNKPKAERPKKYWFSYRLHKYLEPIAMKHVDGLISVSQAYIDTIIERYPNLKNIPQQVITFGAFKQDFDLVKNKPNSFKLPYTKDNNFTHFVYVGRGGHDMKAALILLFTAFKKGLTEQAEQFNKIKFHFIGTSYAPKSQGIATIKPIADEMGIAKYVNEQTDRISFYESIYTLITADALLIIGSDDPQYTASKIYPYILAERPLLAFFHPESSASKIIAECKAGTVISLTDTNENSIEKTMLKLLDFVKNPQNTEIDWVKFENYSAEKMTEQQCKFFNQIV